MGLLHFLLIASIGLAFGQDLWAEFENPGREVVSDTGKTEALPEGELQQGALKNPLQEGISSSSAFDLSSSSSSFSIEFPIKILRKTGCRSE